MPLIKVIKDDKEFHLEIWNEQSIIDLGLSYEFIPIDTNFELSTIEDLQK